MEVTRKNFASFYKELKELLPKAEFISMDLEMTGIAQVRAFADLPFERYLKYRRAANQFRIIQVGLCLFIPTLEKTFEARPYNIFVFPRERFGYSPLIQIDASAADFNTNHGMDWNKWFYEGVTYMNLKEAKKKRQELIQEEEKSDQFEPTDVVKLTREGDILKGEQFKKDLEEWLKSDAPEFAIVGETSFFRRYIYETLKRDYPDLLAESVPLEEGNAKKIVVYKFKNEEEKKAYLKVKRQKKIDMIEEHIGFTKVFELLTESKKRIVGHNCLFDFMFIYSHFLESLPCSYLEFKKRLYECFPEIYDTKFMISQTRFKQKIVSSTHLDEVFSLTRKEDDPDFSDVKIKLGEGFEAYDPDNPEGTKKFHEAGYDAYCTGYAFAKMYYALNNEEREQVKNCINTVGNFFYIKNGEITYEEPWYKKYEFLFLSPPADKHEIESEPLYKVFEGTDLFDLMKFSVIKSENFTGGCLNFDPQSEEQRLLFREKIEKIKELGYNILTYEEYFNQMKEIHEKSGKKN